MKLSIVATLYHSELYIVEFCSRMSDAAKSLVGEDYEIILVNDGSPDSSFVIAAQLVKVDSHITLIDLSRNFGHHKAIMTGLYHAEGDHVFLIDCDLEEEPEWLIGFNNQLIKNKCDVVYGVQSKRRGRFFERWSGQAYYQIFNFLTNIKVPENTVMARLMTRRYVDALLLHKETEVVIAGLFSITGFVQQHQLVMKHSSSETTYSLRKKMAMLVNSVTSFSNTPLVAIFYIGSLISFIAFLYNMYLMAIWSFYSKPLSGWTSVMASIWLIGGMIISFIGVIGIYLSKIFNETKQRPNTVIRQILKGDNKNIPTSKIG